MCLDLGVERVGDVPQLLERVAHLTPRHVTVAVQIELPEERRGLVGLLGGRLAARARRHDPRADQCLAKLGQREMAVAVLVPLRNPALRGLGRGHVGTGHVLADLDGEAPRLEQLLHPLLLALDGRVVALDVLLQLVDFIYLLAQHGLHLVDVTHLLLRCLRGLLHLVEHLAKRVLEDILVLSAALQ